MTLHDLQKRAPLLSSHGPGVAHAVGGDLLNLLVIAAAGDLGGDGLSVFLVLDTLGPQCLVRALSDFQSTRYYLSENIDPFLALTHSQNTNSQFCFLNASA